MVARRKTKRKIVTEGAVYIKATFNNTIVSVTNTSGDVICQRSSGQSGFKGSRKGTPYAAQLAAEEVGKAAKEVGMKTVHVQVSGPGAGREPAIRAIHNVGLEIKTIQDVTPLPHNGCRPSKRRRV